MSTITPSPQEEVASWLQVVESKVAALRFGSVPIIVHEGRVTRIASTEKFRFHSGPSSERLSDTSEGLSTPGI